MPDGFRIASAYVDVEPNTEGFAGRLQSELDAAIGSVHADATAGLDITELEAKADEARARLDDLGSAETRATLGLEDDGFRARLDRDRAGLDEMEGREVSPKLGLDDDEFREKLAADKAAADSAGSEGGGGLIGSIALGVGSLLPGIGGAAAGMGLLAGTGALALGGVRNALEAHSQASQAVGTTSQQMAATAFSNTVAIQQAQQAVGDAYRQAAQDAVTSSAQEVQAQQAVAQAGQQLRDAEYGETQAQENLTQARIQAALTLQQLNDQQKDSVLATRAAQLALEQAQQQQALTDSNAMTTGLQRQQAALAVAEAQRQLAEAQQNQVNSAAAAGRADKAGVEGSQSVVQAKHAVADATQAVGNAQQAQANAVRAAALAGQQAAWTQQRDAEAIATAQRNLSNTYQEQRLQAAATAASSNQAASQFRRDMAGMSPAAQAFTLALLGMHGAWHKLQETAQDAVLPGMTVFLQGVRASMPAITSGVSAMGQVIGSAFAGLGKVMQTPAFQKGLSGLLDNGVQFVKTVIPAFGGFIGELGKVGSQKGAASGLAALLAGVARGLTGIVRAIGPHVGQINSFLKAAAAIVAQIGPPLGRMAGLVAQALGPLTRYLSAHPNGTVVKVIGDVAAGLITLRGLQKILPDFITGPLGKLSGKITGPVGDALKKVPGMLLSPFRSAAGKIPGLLSPVWDAVSSKSGEVFSAVESAAGTAIGTIGRWGAQFATQVASMIGSGAALAEQIAVQMADAAGATAEWIAEHAVAAGTFLAENIAMAASATAAFVAENAATLGLVAGIALLVGAIIYLATHWSQVWGDVKQWAEDAWNFIYNGFGKYLLPLLGPVGFIALGAIELAKHWSAVWGGIKSAFDTVIGGIQAGAHAFVTGMSATWGFLESVFKTPVNFLIGTVYDDGIRRFWDDVVGAVGLGSLKLPYVAKLSGGGKLDGYGGGDIRPALLEPGETVVSKEDSRHPVMRAAFQAAGVPGYSGGGLVGDVGGFFSSIGKDIIGGAEFAAELVTDPGKAISDALGHFIGTSAAGDLGQIMTAIPKAILGSLARAVESIFAAGGGPLTGSDSAVGALPANWRQIASFLVAHGFSKFAAAGVAGNVDAESGGQPEIREIGGGGGGGLIQWTPTPAGYITGDPARDLITQLYAITRWGGGPAQVNRANSPSNAAEIYQDLYERPASLTASLARRMASANAVYEAMGWAGAGSTGRPQAAPGVASRYDSGGWLQPGPVNQTGRPEAVLTPDESAAFVALVREMAAARRGGGPAGSEVTVNQNYYGTQYPTPSQRALMRRDLAMALSGG